MIEWKELSSEDAEQIRIWRNQSLKALRTPYPLTKEQQEDWYIGTVCDRGANSRWFGLWSLNELVGYTGIENISWENRIGEISLLIGPDYQKQGFGRDAVDLILTYAFDELNLNCVFGECYDSNENAIKFWRKITEQRDGYTTALPCRKYTNGKYASSLYFSIEKPI